MDNGQYTHYLINFTGKGEPVGQEILAVSLGNALIEAGVELCMATMLVTPIAVDPRDVGLKDNWELISPIDKKELAERFPYLVTAIELICGTKEEV